MVFGGHDYLERTTGLTYAEYVHQGFGQLTVVTALTLLVVWAAARKAPRETPADRAWLRAALGLLCVLTLVVVASALYRMHVYQEAYGFTRLRLLVDVFEGWLGLVVLGVLVAGIGLRGAWLSRAAVLTGAAALLGLAAINPDAWIAEHNLERYETTGKVDESYLFSLSADAVPLLVDAGLVPGTGCAGERAVRRRLARVEPRPVPGECGARGRPGAPSDAWSSAPSSRSGANRFAGPPPAFLDCSACPAPTPTTTPSRSRRCVPTRSRHGATKPWRRSRPPPT